MRPIPTLLALSLAALPAFASAADFDNWPTKYTFGDGTELAATASLLAEVGRLLPGVSSGEEADGEDGEERPHYAEAGAYNVTFHAEATDDPISVARDIRAAGAKAGLSVKPGTPIEPYLDILRDFDTLLVMSVEPGLPI